MTAKAQLVADSRLDGCRLQSADTVEKLLIFLVGKIIYTVTISKF
jgi:hypothetical protein